jgi:peptidyl-prolyl cis-trans isomerase B (cyclophilin B)
MSTPPLRRAEYPMGDDRSMQLNGHNNQSGAGRRSRVTLCILALIVALAGSAMAEHHEAAGTPTGVDAIKKFIKDNPVNKQKPSWKSHLKKPPRADFDASKKYYWLLETNVGSIKIELMPDVAPMHVTSTIYLTELGFYDDVPFHRVIPGFMAQGGDPTGTGRGGPGYKYSGEYDPKFKHDKPGMLSMANAGPGTDGSQFFLTFVPTPHLNGKHTLFGQIVEGMGTMKEMEKFGSRPRGTTKKDLRIEHASIQVE